MALIRIALASVLAVSLLVARPSAEAQPPKKAKIGILHMLAPTDSPAFPAFRDRLRELGYIEGRNFVFAYRGPRARPERLSLWARERAGGVSVLQAAEFSRIRGRIAELGLKYRLPTISGEPGFVEAGGLMTYGPNIIDLWRQAAVYVDKILKGAKPADLPIEQPTRFEFVLNVKTAKALGLDVPTATLLRADKVIE